MYHNLFFDLDGTLADTEEGILLSLQYALSQMGIDETDRQVLHAFIGPPLKDIFMSHYGMNEEAALETLAHYRVYYGDSGMYKCKLFPGVETLLHRLHSEGVHLFVATSKPGVYAEKILSHLGVADLFTEIAGSMLDNTRSKKHEVIDYLLGKYPDTAKDVLMIGDKIQDLNGAEACGIPAVGVLYGYGGAAELAGGKSAALVKDTEELYRFVTETHPA